MDIRRLRGQILGVDHIAIAVDDLESSVRWYESVLGFEVVDRKATHGEYTSMVSAVLSLGGVTFVLLEGNEPESQVSRFIANRGPGVHHIALAVRSLDEARAILLEHHPEITITPVISSGPNRQIVLERPSEAAVRIELIERGDAPLGVFSDDGVEQLFRAFEKNDVW